jgi:hypothetical protein
MVLKTMEINNIYVEKVLNVDFIQSEVLRGSEFFLRSFFESGSEKIEI